MSWFQNNNTLSGPAVDAVIQAVQHMFNLGAPVEDNLLGFNKTNYSDPVLGKIQSYPLGSNVPQSELVHAVNALKVYKNTQVTNWPTLYQGINELIKSQAPVVTPGQPANDKKVQFAGQGTYGKIAFIIPGIDKKPLVAIVRDKMANSGDIRFKQAKDMYGKMAYPVFKAFSINKSTLDCYDILPDFLPDLSVYLKSQGYDTSDMDKYVGNPTEPANATKALIKSGVVAAVMDGINLVINIDGFNAQWNNFGKHMGGRIFKDSQGKWAMAFRSPLKLLGQKLIDFLAPSYDVTALKAIVETLPEVADPEADNKADFMLNIKDETATGIWHLSIQYLSKDNPNSEALKQAIRYSMIDFIKDFNPANTGKYAVKDGKAYFKAEYLDYIDLYNSLRSRGFDVTELAKIVSDLVAKGLIAKTRKPGILDGYANVEKFYEKIDSLKPEGFEPYKEQKEGVAFLYSRQSALLGDHVGVGKSYQMITAMHMRMEQSGGRAILVTKLAAKDQIAKQIVRFTKCDPSEVSTNIHEKKKWTVMHYEEFQVPATRDATTQEIIDQAKTGAITCLTLDECHNVKNDSIRTENVQKFAPFIPFTWGASATIIANKPIDVYNQLKSINHKLGTMTRKKFMAEFGGVSVDKGKTKEEELADQIRAVNRLKEALVDQRTFIQRSKKDIRDDMPDQIISNNNVNVDQNQLSNKIWERMSKYKDTAQDLPIAAIIAFRAEVAQAKAPQTIANALKIMQQGKKVAIFTDFSPVAKMISEGLKAQAEAMGGTVGAIVGGMKGDSRNELVADFQKPESKIMAMTINTVAGGTGIDFPNVLNDVFVNDFNWSVAQDEQALGRFYRINSNSDINVTYTIAQGTRDAEFFEYMQNKKVVSKEIENLTQRQMTLLLGGFRKNNSEELKAIEQKLMEWQEKAIALEAHEKSMEQSVGQAIYNQAKATGESGGKQANILTKLMKRYG